MKIEEGQKKQFIVLCCLVVAVIGIGVFRMVSTGTGSASPASDQVQPAQAKALEVASAVPATAMLGYTPGRPRDPFAPQVLLRKPALPKIPVVAREPLPDLPRGLVIPPGMAGGFPPMQPIKVTPAAEEEAYDPTRDLRLSGVVEGDTCVAVVRGAGGSRYIVREGDTIAGACRVTAISRSGVVLRVGNRTVVLRLGGRNAAHTAPES